MTIIGMIHPVHKMRHPSGVRLDASDLELRMSLEDGRPGWNIPMMS